MIGILRISNLTYRSVYAMKEIVEPYAYFKSLGICVWPQDIANAARWFRCDVAFNIGQRTIPSATQWCIYISDAAHEHMHLPLSFGKIVKPIQDDIIVSSPGCPFL